MQVELLPLISVTVKVTVFAPTFAQLNEFGETAYDAIPQSSVELLLTSDAMIEAVPALFN